MTKRTDIHRPSSPSFDPQNYELFGVFDLYPVNDDVFGGPVVPLQDRLGYTIDRLRKQGWRVDDIGDRSSVGGQCAHCGAYIRYAALLTYEPDLTLITVGEDCLNNRFNGNLTKQKFQQLRKNAALNAKRRNLKQQVQDVLDAHPLLERWEEVSGYSYGFVSDVMRRLENNGELSDKQIAAVEKAIEKSIEWDKKRQQWEAEAVDADDAPTGKVTVTGEIISTKWQESGFRTVHKMTVKTDKGWKLWVTVPSSVYDPSDSSLPITGKRVTLTANVTPSDRDPKFAFGKRPTNASVIS
jgi:hypothetical protein